MYKYIALFALLFSTLACQLQAAPEPANGAGAVSAPVRQIANGQTGGIVIAEIGLKMRNIPDYMGEWSFVVQTLPAGQPVFKVERVQGEDYPVEWCKIRANEVTGWSLCRYIEWR